MKQLYWVIIPSYNESEYLHRVLKKVKNVWPYFVVVDDGSEDGSYKIAKKFTRHVLQHSVNLGKGAAMKTGSEYAFTHLNAAGVIFFDADDQHDASLIPHLAKCLIHSPVVFGVRSFTNEMPLARIIANRLASFIVLLIFGQYIPDIPSGFKALSKNAYKKIDWQSVDYLVETEIAARIAQYNIRYDTVTIPTIYHDLDRGMTVLDILHMAYHMATWRFRK